MDSLPQVKQLLSSPLTPVSFLPWLVEVFTRVERDPQARVIQVHNRNIRHMSI